MGGAASRDGEIQDARTRVLDAASHLIATGGVAALTTRAVAAAASVQAPALYRLFGEKRGLLNAVAERGLAAFVSEKTNAQRHPDAVQDLRDAWDSYVAFGLANPAVFAIMNEVGSPASGSPATLAGIAVLHQRVQQVARAGRLGVPVERAVALIHAAGVGTVVTSLATPDEARDPMLAPLARDAVLAAILVGSPHRQEEEGIAPLAVSIGARLDEVVGLTPGERLLLKEMLDRLSTDQPPSSGPVEILVHGGPGRG